VSLFAAPPPPVRVANSILIGSQTQTPRGAVYVDPGIGTADLASLHTATTVSTAGLF